MTITRSRARVRRRSLGLGALGAAFAALGAGDPVRANRRFLFVHAEGGWDPLCLFAPLFDAPQIQMEPDAEPMSIGNLKLVGSPARPKVEEFFRRFADRTLLINGLSTRSVNHGACAAIANTGTLSPGASDWATLLAAAESSTYHLPHAAFDVPVFPGTNAASVVRAEGMLAEALHGTITEDSDQPVARLSEASRPALDRFLESAAQGLTDTTDHPLPLAQRAAVMRSHALVEARDLVVMEPSVDIGSRARNAVRLLANGVSRCASFKGNVDVQEWDTHVNNAQQSALFEALFSELAVLMDLLAGTPALDGAPLADSTVIVVLSEMGRTPAFNANGGRDHWPFTTAMVLGSGITGDRMVGGYNEAFQGVGADPATGDLDAARVGVDAETFGATLLALGGVDHEEVLPGAQPIAAVLA